MSIKLTREEILSRINNLLPNNLIILDNSQIENLKSPITIQCKNCQRIKTIQAQTILYGRVGCSACSNSKPEKGVNDIATKNPEIIPFLANKEDAYKYTSKSNLFIQVKCPNCKTERKMQISHLTTRGFTCQVCGDGISYPNKFARSFLLQLPIQNLQFEYSPQWINPLKYDNYFEYQGNKYILEMDGGLGHGGKNYCNNKEFNGKERDNFKDLKAQENEIEVIRIESLKSEKDYLKNNILNSRLNQIFNLSNIDWNKCEQYCTSSLLTEVCKAYKEGNHSTKQLSQDFKLGISTIQRYLKRGTNLKLCDYNKNNWKENHNNKQDRTPKITFIYDKNNKLLLQTDNLKQGIDFLNQQIGENIFNYSSVISKLQSHNNDITYKDYIIKRLKKGEIICQSDTAMDPAKRQFVLD